MVKVCSIEKYSDEDAENNSHYFEKYPYELSIFQKHAIQGIVEGNHVIITAHTGSGKTLAAEFSIEYFVSKGRKVIYTMPIKTLGNQKFYEFSKKYPHISFGLITGDIKINSDAQVLIMTAEILLNKLYQKTQQASCTSFDMDIEHDLACVVMDEIHYINDKERGKTWEETIIMLPQHVQMVMLSATIDSPERFASWCETRHPESGKIVYLASTYKRIVPLTHFAFITSPSALYKVLKDKTKEEELKQQVFNKMLPIQSSTGVFNEPTFHLLKNTLQLLNTKQVFTKRQFVLNQVCKHLVEHNMLPALCFVLSRKMLEQCAKEITVPLLEDDSKVGYIIEQECEQIIRKMPNYKEYLNLPEYIQMVALLQKGIAIHHAGVMPVLREMVELLYAKGYIKLLFATETFAVGINMPTKSVIFTDICKFDGNNNRILYPHEYNQMGGRAGRRGIDILGNVILLPNLFREFELTSFRNMMQGGAQVLRSKFKLSYNLFFNLISLNLATNNKSCINMIEPMVASLEPTVAATLKPTVDSIKDYIAKSMIHDELSSELKGINNQIKAIKEEIVILTQSFKHLRTPVDTIQTYLLLLDQRTGSVNKKRKEIDRAIQQITDDHKFVEKDKLTIIKCNDKNNELKLMNIEYINASQYIDNNIEIILSLLTKFGFINNIKLNDVTLTETYELTIKGTYATQLREVNCLVFAQLYEDNIFNILTAKQCVMLFSCFTNVSVNENDKSLTPKCRDERIKSLAETISSSLQFYLKEENDNKLSTGTNYDMHYDLLDYVAEWWDCDTEEECKFILQKMEKDKGIFLGEFVKALLKINNVSAELESIAEKTGNIDLLQKLKSIPLNTLKFVATNQSLYV